MPRKLNDKFQENLSRPGITDARARYRAAARRLRNTTPDRIWDQTAPYLIGSRVISRV